MSVHASVVKGGRGERKLPFAQSASMETAAPYTSAFGGFNYYPTSAFKRSASSSPQQGHSDGRLPSPSAAPLLRRYRTSSSPTPTRRRSTSLPPASTGQASLPSSDAVPVRRARNQSPGGGVGKGKQQQQRTPATQQQRAGRSGVGPGIERTPSPQAPPDNRPPRNTSRSGGKAARFTSPSASQPSPGGVTPSMPRSDTGDGSPSSGGGTRRRVLSGEASPFLARASDVSVCVDGSCMHSRQSIAEFIEMQRELRRCYAALATREDEVEALRERLTAAETTLKEREAQADARLHEREKELLVEMARRERELQAEAWEHAKETLLRSTPAAGATASASCEDEESDGSGDEEESNAATVLSEPGPGGTVNRATESENEARARCEADSEELIADMRRTIFQLEDALAQERAERHAAVQELRANVEERTQLQAHIRLLSTWREERLHEQERAENEKARLWKQKRLLSPTPPRPPVDQTADTATHREGEEEAERRTPATAAQTPLQKLLARGTRMSPSSPPSWAAAPSASPGRHGGGVLTSSAVTPQRLDRADSEAEAAEHLVTIRRSPTPRRPAPAAPQETASAEPPLGARETGEEEEGTSVGERATSTGGEPAATTTPSWWESAAHTNSPASPSSASSSLAACEARCRELLRALLDKERQLAVVAAERTLYRRQLNDLGAE